MANKKTGYDAFLASLTKMGECTDYSCMVNGFVEGGAAGLTIFAEMIKSITKSHANKNPNEQEQSFFKVLSCGVMMNMLATKTLLEATPDKWACKYLSFITTNLAAATAVHSGVVTADELTALESHIAFLSAKTVKGILGGQEEEKSPQEDNDEETILNMPEGFMEGLKNYFDDGQEGERFHDALGRIFRRS